MSKRFIDTGIFDDEWFMNLSQDGKILWIYFITKCDHAGILKLNTKLCQVQTDIKSISTVIKELGNRLVTVSEHIFFIPKFIEYQYPGFPNSKVRQQQSAVEILTRYKLYDEGILTVRKELAVSDISVYKEPPNSSVNEIDNGPVDEYENVPVNIEFAFFWNLYDKDEDRIQCEVEWIQLSHEEREDCILKLSDYIKSTPNKQFRKNPINYLKNRSWNNANPSLSVKPLSTGNPEATSPDTHETRQIFKPPILEEVEAYCKERNNGINPIAFLNHYETVGWRYGKGPGKPIKDWKSAVRTWEDRRKKELQEKGIDRGQHPGQVIVDGTVKAQFKTD